MGWQADACHRMAWRNAFQYAVSMKKFYITTPTCQRMWSRDHRGMREVQIIESAGSLGRIGSGSLT